MMGSCRQPIIGDPMTRSATTKLSTTAAIVAAAGLAAAGCSHTPPAEEISLAHTSVARAVAHPDAAVQDVKRAQDKLALARRWSEARDYGPARWLLEQAEVDAELALARAAGRDARRILAQREQARTAGVLASYLTGNPQ